VIGLAGQHTLGEVNPSLNRAFAEGLTPYINNIAGSPDQLPGFHRLDEQPQFDDYSMANTKGLFAVLNSDSTTATEWNKAVYEQALYHETAFAQNPSNSGANAHLTAAATLRGLVDAGTVGAFDAYADNQNKINMTESQWKGMGYNAALTAFSTGTAVLPGGEAVSPLISGVGATLQGEILGTTDPIDPSDPINNLSPQIASKHILNAMSAAGHPLPFPQAHYDANNNLVYPPGAAAVLVEGQVVCPPDVDTTRHNQAVIEALTTVLGPAAGGYAAIEGMLDAYNGVTKIPNPH
jgi:hypothetical protein